MYGRRRGLIGLACAAGIGALSVPSVAVANPSAPGADQTLSPYFYVAGGDPDTDELPLKATDVDISVAGVIADVSVSQTYENRGSRAINAKYVFPGSTRAAVHGLTMTIGEKRVVAKIKEREEARRTYEEARAAGKSASLLEQHRPNVFSMEVANIMPGDTVKVELRYTELLVPENGVYELVYPTVVGPRYAGNAESGDEWIASPYTGEGEEPTYDFGLSARVASGMPLQALSSPSHAIEVDWKGKSEAKVALGASETKGGNRDFVLRYKLAGDKVDSGLMLYENGGEKFFLLTVQPPERVTDEVIPPREYVFVIDISGSMGGFPLDTAKALMHELAAELRPNDRFNVILFSGGSHLMEPRSVPATPENLAKAMKTIDEVRGGGGTELLPALERAMALPASDVRSRSFVVITDGYIAADAQVFGYIKDHLGDANVFAFGIGSSVNRHLIEGMAKAGAGEPFVVLDETRASGIASKFAAYVGRPVLTNVKVETEGFTVRDLAPAHLPDVLADRPIVVKGKWTGAPHGKITVTGRTGSGAYAHSFDVARTPVSKTDRALAYLWARERIAELSDYASPDQQAAAREQITELGLTYNLLTKHTSFVAVLEQVRNTSGDAADIDQPLPMPQGVSNQAIGSSNGIMVGSEPELWFLVLVVLAFLGVTFARRRRENLAA